MKASPTLLLPLLLAGCSPQMASELPNAPAHAKVAPPQSSAKPLINLAPDEAFRATPPDPGPSPGFSIPPLETSSLENGTKLVIVRTPGISWGAVAAVSNLNDFDFLDEPVGLRYFVVRSAWLSAGGTDLHSFRTELVKMMADDGNTIYPDGQSHWIHGFGTNLPEAARILMRVVTRPDFTPNHMEFFKGEVRSQLAATTNDSSTILSHVFCKVNLGNNHPYCRDRYSSDADLAQISRESCIEAHNKLFAPAMTTIIAAGDFDVVGLKSVVNDAYRLAAPATIKPKTKVPPPKPKTKVAVPILPSSARIVVIDRPGAKQARLSYGSAGPAQRFEDQAAVEVMNQLLVGPGIGTVTRSLRNELLVDWSGDASTHWGRYATTIEWEGSVDANSVGPLIRDLSSQLRRAMSGNIEPSDLESARQRLLSHYASAFETPYATVQKIQRFVELEIPLTEITDAPRRISSVTADQVKSAIRTWLDPDKARIVIHGDWTSLREALIRLDLGPIEIRDSKGEIVRVENQRSQPPAPATRP